MVEALPSLPPGLHCALFRDRVIQEVSAVGKSLIELGLKSGPDDKILEHLEELLEFCVDRLVLQKTQIGRTVAGLKRHSHPIVRQRSEALLAQWKKDHELRENVTDGFHKKLLEEHESTMSSSSQSGNRPKEEVQRLLKRKAKELEEGLFAVTCPSGMLEAEFYRAYKRQYSRLCTHLKTRGEGSLAERILLNQIDASEVPKIPNEELITEDQRRRDEGLRLEGLRNCQVAGDSDAAGLPTTEYTCPRCESNNCTYRESQTGWHTSQQDVTIFVFCKDCNNRWKAQDEHGVGGG